MGILYTDGHEEDGHVRYTLLTLNVDGGKDHMADHTEPERDTHMIASFVQVIRGEAESDEEHRRGNRRGSCVLW